jgi:hypothetical protein
VTKRLRRNVELFEETGAIVENALGPAVQAPQKGLAEVVHDRVPFQNPDAEFELRKDERDGAFDDFAIPPCAFLGREGFSGRAA